MAATGAAAAAASHWCQPRVTGGGLGALAATNDRGGAAATARTQRRWSRRGPGEGAPTSAAGYNDARRAARPHTLLLRASRWHAGGWWTPPTPPPLLAARRAPPPVLLPTAPQTATAGRGGAAARRQSLVVAAAAADTHGGHGGAARTGRGW